MVLRHLIISVVAITICSTLAPVVAMVTAYGDLEDYPDPRTDFEKCGREKPSFVCDPNGLLNGTVNLPEELDVLIEEIQNSTKCPCVSCPEGGDGYMMAVAVVPWLDLPPGVERTKSEVQQQVQNVSAELRERWSLGSCGNDAVLLLSVHDKMVYTSTGIKMNLMLPRGCAERISNSVREYTESENYGLGLLKILTEFKVTLASDRMKRCGDLDDGASLMLLACILAAVSFTLVVASSAFCCWKRSKGGGD